MAVDFWFLFLKKPTIEELFPAHIFLLSSEAGKSWSSVLHGCFSPVGGWFIWAVLGSGIRLSLPERNLDLPIFFWALPIILSCGI